MANLPPLPPLPSLPPLPASPGLSDSEFNSFLNSLPPAPTDAQLNQIAPFPTLAHPQGQAVTFTSSSPTTSLDPFDPTATNLSPTQTAPVAQDPGGSGDTSGSGLTPNQTAPVAGDGGITTFDPGGQVQGEGGVPIGGQDLSGQGVFPGTPTTTSGAGALNDFFQTFINDVGGLFTRLFLVILGIVALGVAFWAFASKDVKAGAVRAAKLAATVPE